MGRLPGPQKVFLLLFAPLVYAAKTAEPWAICSESCQACLQPVHFNDTQLSDLNIVQSCQSGLGLYSTYLCLEIYCGSEYRRLALQERNETCQSALGLSIPPFSIVANLTSDNAADVRRITEDDVFDPSNPAREIVLPALDFFTAWYDTLDTWAYARKWHFYYGFATVAFWIFVVGLGITNRVYLALSRLPACRATSESICGPSSSVFQRWIKRRVLLPATFGYKCAQSVMWSTVPPRIQSLTLLLFLVLNVVFSVCGYKTTKKSFYFDSPFDLLLRCVSDRTGVLSFANFPVIWLFGMRNNVSLWLTGWDFGTYNNFHRWVARIATVEAVAHSIGYTMFVWRQGGAWDWNYLITQFADWYWNAGVVATGLMALLLPLSIYWMRRRRYELFLILHILISLLLLLFMLGHVSIFNGQYDGLFWVPVFIWLFDRVLRACRIVAFNPFSWGTDSFAVYHNTSNVVQLSIPVESNSAYLARPGTYYYIMVLDDTCCWESHPFTVASVPVSPQSPDETYSEMSPLLHDPHDMANSEPGSRRAPAMKLRNNCMTFLIRPYNDFTRRLKELAISSGRMRVLVDGPYGHAHPLHHYDRVVFVVGGSGIVTPMSYLPLLGRTHSHSTPKMVEIHWAVREVSFAETVVWEYLHRALSTNALSLNLYVSSSSTDDATSERGFPPWVRQHQKRPHVAQIVDSAAMESDYGRLAIVACGPEALVDDARLAVVDILERSTCHIDYFQENFFW